MRIEALSEQVIDEVLPLEKLIKQYARNVQSEEFRGQLLSQFIEWEKQGFASCKVVYNEENELVAYFLLILNEELMDQFFYHSQERNSHCSYLAQIAVKKEAQGKGLGLQLMQLIQEISLQNGKKRLVLEVHSESLAYQWYRQLGFEEICSQVFLGMNLRESSNLD